VERDAVAEEYEMAANQPGPNQERTVHVRNGWMMLVVWLAVIAATVGVLVSLEMASGPRVALVGAASIAAFLLSGLFTLQPNEARVLILFGNYHGTVREGGFHWANPLYSNGIERGPLHRKMQKLGSGKEPPPATHRALGRNKMSLRARTLNGQRLKVNDRRGNPVEIAAVVVWKVRDTAQAVFDVEDYEEYVHTQSESALRHLASQYSYDNGEEREITLRSNVDEVSQALRTELQERLGKAGVIVDEARLTHLAYAPEIAQAMLRRQQAEAVIAAREKLVHGAVSMVHMALQELAAKDVVHLDDERRAAMVSNLMVVLCGESEVHPVVNAGTLYN
jgi:regulator of protease activity HflC (stomatin/prohibitin superfamily)